MKQIRLRLDEDPAHLNYRIDVFHLGINLVSSVMAEPDLRQLLDLCGYLKIAPFENWVELITSGTDRPQFALDRKGTVVYYVSAVEDEATHIALTMH